ncbi:MAG: polysaccharide deacetylase family protein [Acidimicrobiia bacterium]
MDRRLCFRFDVDSHECLSAGSGPLIEAAARLDVALTFFVNMGRATSRVRVLRSSWRVSPSHTATRLPTARKLSRRGLVRLVLTNPRVGVAMGDHVRRIVDAGHEVGLHGGRNHRAWQESAHTWSADRLATEIEWGLERLSEIGVDSPAGFASPAWNSPSLLPEVARNCGFSYLADLHDPDSEGVRRDSIIPNAVTNVIGEPGGVGFLEWHRARGATDVEIETDFRRRLSKVRSLAVVYDHPFWAGRHDANIVSRLMEVGLEEGFGIAALGEVVCQPS